MLYTQSPNVHSVYAAGVRVHTELDYNNNNMRIIRTYVHSTTSRRCSKENYRGDTEPGEIITVCLRV